MKWSFLSLPLIYSYITFLKCEVLDFLSKSGTVLLQFTSRPSYQHASYKLSRSNESQNRKWFNSVYLCDELGDQQTLRAFNFWDTLSFYEIVDRG